MARTLGPVRRLCRRESARLFLKGDRCYTEKCSVDRRAYPPGQHGQARPRVSNYGAQLREKQKVKRMYGLMERQFAGTVDRATRMRGRSGENLLQLLERRLDNVVFRLGFATSRAEARELVRELGAVVDAVQHHVLEGHEIARRAVEVAPARREQLRRERKVGTSKFASAA